MKLWGIFRFEVAYHCRRVATWVYLATYLGLAIGIALIFVQSARKGGFYFNAPIVIAAVTAISSLFGLLVTAAVAGDAATRDLHTRMAPLHYTAPIGKAAYLGGRFLGACAVNGLLLLASVPLGLAMAMYLPGMDAQLVGPFRPAAYLGAWLNFALPNVFVATALLFSLAVLSRRTLASYGGAVLLFVLSNVAKEFVAGHLGRWALGTYLDPTGFTGLSALWRSWTPSQKNLQLVGLAGPLLTNRLLWLGLAAAGLGLAFLRFRFAHHASNGGRSQQALRLALAVPQSSTGLELAAAALGPVTWSVPVAMPAGSFSSIFSAHLWQALAIALRSFQAILASRSALVLPLAAVMMVIAGPELLEGELGTPSLPTTGRIAMLSGHVVIGMMVAAFTTLFAGQLVWQERAAGLSDLADASPVPNWVLYVGKFLGLLMLLFALQVVVLTSGILIQLLEGYHHFEIGLYLRILFGLRLTDYLLFAVVAMVGHVLVRDKYLGHLAVFLVYLYITYAGQFGLEHHLLVYGSAPGWKYSDMGGFGAFAAPWVWFKLYWAGWAVLLGLLLMLFWVRGREPGLGGRMREARRRFSRVPATVAAASAGSILLLGGFVFYNTNVLNHYQPTAKRAERQAAYERRFGQYRNVLQPVLTGTKLHVELYPSQGQATISGTYRLVNHGSTAIDSIHLVSSPDVQITTVHCDRPARLVLADEEFGYHILALYQPLPPGDTLRLHFELRIGTRGFANSDSHPAVARNGTWLEQSWLPAVGYQPGRELPDAATRRQYRLPTRPAVRSLHDAAARQSPVGREQIRFEATIGTEEGQTAVAPGTLRRTWRESGRRYFHYAMDKPIRNVYAIFSGRYAVHTAHWQHVPIQIFYHPGHAHNLSRMVRSVQASLAYYTRQFGPYPYSQLRLVETPGAGSSMRLTAYPGTIMYTEAFALVSPRQDQRLLDLPFAVVAHEVAHQWWGHQLVPADVEGAPVLTESLAWYSAMMVVEETHGREQLSRLLHMMRREYLTPRESAGVPLLRATDHFGVYRKGPFAMYALRECLGKDSVNSALRKLLRQYGSGKPPLPVSLDLYRELQAVAPDSLRGLLHDLFAANTFWELKASTARAVPAGAGPWQVTLTIKAQKVTVDSLGTETPVSMHDLVEVGLYAAGPEGELGKPLYLRRHQIRAGTQTLTVRVPARPASAGIDPRRLLIDRNVDDNLVEVSQPATPPLSY
ncbi:M1 family aminopeptidase [Hymenobacter sp. BT770]|uniref:M1 family aminopeptidase n=1 Tax=Hymenobacter sp. BT770 TaxID=2886942 RepID=UPI001D11E920|nr:M1 family aminopeptidase [Hymenobacter sp. BT770]MCC3153587.1 ABC transporter permease [Hymenobacter sp. BT770]MDO3415823.1 M1 family aminopeptidase [Hymenobacter sp. BT770]